jgi:hypothetical protein
MNTPSSLREASFTNSYGEEWKFSFDSVSGMATISGDDIDWETYPVVEGTAYGLVMSKDEAQWLHQVWVDFSSGHPSANLYLARPTEFIRGKKHCSLSNNYCPICLLQKREFEIHHCIAATHGGPDTSSNLLSICNSCHAIMNHGSIEDRAPKNLAALSHQLMYFGVKLYQDACAYPNKRTKANFVERSKAGLELSKSLSEVSPEELEQTNKHILAEARIEYQLHRDIGLGKWPWSEYEARSLKPFRLWLTESDA